MTDGTSNSGNIHNNTLVANTNNSNVPTETHMIDEGTNVRESQVTSEVLPPPHYSTKQTVYYQMMTSSSQKKHLHDYAAADSAAAGPEHVQNNVVAMASSGPVDGNN